jgi:hypothetical protein
MQEPSDIHQQPAQLRRLLERKFGDFQSLYQPAVPLRSYPGSMSNGFWLTVNRRLLRAVADAACLWAFPDEA